MTTASDTAPTPDGLHGWRMGVSPEQNKLNLRSAEKLVAADMGVSPDANAALTYEQRIEFNKRLAEKILQYPDRFTDGTKQTAKMVRGAQYQPLADPSFDWDNFQSEVVDNAVKVGDAFVDVGTGAQTAISSLKWILPILLIVGAAGLAKGLFKKGSNV